MKKGAAMKPADKRHLVLKVKHIGLIYYGLKALQKEENTITDRDINNALDDIRFQTGIDEATMTQSILGKITHGRLKQRLLA